METRSSDAAGGSRVEGLVLEKLEFRAALSSRGFLGPVKWALTLDSDDLDSRADYSVLCHYAQDQLTHLWIWIIFPGYFTGLFKEFHG